jgi:DNA-binding MarR family transcriptional regulator
MAVSANVGFVDDYLAALLAQASHLISSEFHRVVRRHDLSVSEWRVLATLASLVNGQSSSVGRLAQITLSKQSTLTRLLDRMQLKGHVKRVVNKADRRITAVRITASGRRVVAGLISAALEHEQRVLEPFGLTSADELKRTLRQIIELHRGENSPT